MRCPFCGSQVVKSVKVTANNEAMLQCRCWPRCQRGLFVAQMQDKSRGEWCRCGDSRDDHVSFYGECRACLGCRSFRWAMATATEKKQPAG